MTEPDDSTSKPSLLQVIGSVLAAMFGVQSSRARRRDFTHGKPAHYIIVGIVMVALLIGIILLAVRLLLRQNGL